MGMLKYRGLARPSRMAEAGAAEPECEVSSMVVTAPESDVEELLAALPSTGVLPTEVLHRFELQGSERHLGALEMVDVAGKPFRQALRVSTQVGATQEWHVRIAADTAAAIDAGDVLFARFWARCTATMSGQGVLGFAFETGANGGKPVAERRLSVGSEWVECVVPFEVSRAFPAGEARVCFDVGYDEQTIELGGISLANFRQRARWANLPCTRVAYHGQAPDADWRAAAAERIERYRKGNLLVEVTDQAGRPVTGAAVKVALRRHAFGFGAAVSAEKLNDPSTVGQHFRRVVKSLFNRATFENDMKWPAVYDGVPPHTDAAVQWLREQQIEIRGHNLLWPSWRWLPAQLRQYRDDPVALRKEAAAHVSDTVAHFRGQLIQWDVVNEPYSEHDLLDALGRDVMLEWFALARQADPKVKLFLNDYGIFNSGSGRNEHADHFYDTLWFLRDRGAPLDGIGIQSHFTADLPSPQAVWATLERFSQLGLPIESTELTINLEDRQLQAEFLRDYLTVLFSHPNVDGATVWGFWERGHWRPHSAFYGDDWSIRPQGQAFARLVQDTWTTRAAESTNHAGQAVVRGFCGTYDVSVTMPDGHIQRATAQVGREGGRARITAGRAKQPTATSATAAEAVLD